MPIFNIVVIEINELRLNCFKKWMVKERKTKKKWREKSERKEKPEEGIKKRKEQE